MNIFWGILLAAIGLFMFISGLTKSNFIIYKILIMCSEKMWGKNVHKFHVVIEILVMIVGVLVALGVS